MGGSIGFTIREENGTEHRMCRWTNTMENLIKDMGFYNKSKKHLSEYLKTWYDMVADYDAAKKGIRPLPEITMVDIYAPNPFLAPMDYGLVVVDYMTNNVLNLQGYTSLDKLDCGIVYGDIRLSNKKGNKEDFEYFIELCENKRIVGVIKKEIDSNTQKFKIVTEEKTFNFNEAVQYLERGKEDNTNFGNYFKINTEPWTFTRYPENKQGVIDFRKRVLELGFVLTKKEISLWDKFEKHYAKLEND